MSRLSSSGQREQDLSEKSKVPVEFDLTTVGFVHMHRSCQKVLPKGPKRVLGVGCHPGRYMWYFARYFEYDPCGLEYVDTLARMTVQRLEEIGIDANVVAVYFFSDATLEKLGRCDVVSSFGFVEHFSDTRDVIERHLRYTRQGGVVLIFIPNHSGIYGWIMKRLNPGRCSMHNLMSFEDLKAGNPEGSGELIVGGYVGRLGFWNCWLYQWARDKGKLFYILVRGPFWILERLGRLLPDSKLLSPEAAVAIRRV